MNFRIYWGCTGFDSIDLWIPINIGSKHCQKKHLIFGEIGKPGNKLYDRFEQYNYYMAAVYILYSKYLNKYYIGSCCDLKVRLEQHKNKISKRSFTAKARDWELFFSAEKLGYKQARLIERHIKRMKSRKYLQDILKYPQIFEKLKYLYK